MNLLRHASIELRRWKHHATRWTLRHRLVYRYPSLSSDPTAIWDYGYHDIDAIELGRNVTVGPHAQVIVYKHNTYSSLEGRLIVGDHALIQSGVRVLASGGEVRIGAYSAIASNSVVVAANHALTPDKTYLYNPMDESRTGVVLGRNVWVGANCVLLPGTLIGDNAVVAAGAVVRDEIPANQLWGGVPAKKIKDIPRTG